LKENKTDNKYTTRFQIRSYEVDETGETSMPTICNLFQESAGLHAHELNFDISDLFKKGMTWILYQLHVKIEKFPKRWDNVVVKTWPSAGDGIRAFRDYELFADDGEKLAAGLSQWMVLDLKKKRPVKIPKEILQLGAGSEIHVLDESRENIETISGKEPDYITKVGRQDLDMNNHVNNVKYVEWITGHQGDVSLKCNELKIQYISEARLGDKIYLSGKQYSGQRSQPHVHTLFSGSGEKIIAKSKSFWR